MITTGMIYESTQRGAFYASLLYLNEAFYDFLVTLTSEEIDAMCVEETNHINLDLYCFNNNDGSMTSITNGVGFNIGVNLCCNRYIGPDDQSRVSNNKDKIFTFDKKEESEYSEKRNTNQFSDYYIYDLHGNQIVILQNQSTNLTVQEQISNLSIQTGIYFVRFWNGTEMETTKVFKL
jgi:hypothetical protein